MPGPAGYTLHWSAEQNEYILFTLQNKEAPVRAGDDDAWYEWLTSHNSFSFHGKHGVLSFQKEKRPRGKEAYWYAYRRQGKRMLKKYAGRSVDLSLARLETMAQTPGAQAPQATAPRQQRRAPFSNQTGTGGFLNERPLPLTNSRAQADILLMPKLRPPRLHAPLVEREHLLARLDAGLERQLTLLSAPAGFGKTTLVRAWMNARGALLPPLAWLALDAGDNDALRFWHYLIAACQTLQPGLENTALALLRQAQQPPFPRRPLEAMLIALLNELARLPGQSILVLEDYHVITAPDIHQAMNFFLEHLPATLHLVLITRVDPPLPLARLRAHDDLVELGAAQLCFSQAEADAFMRLAYPFTLDETVLDRLLARAEGWVTGLRLIALTLQGQGQLSAREMERQLSTISGSQRPILEYLVAEVLSAQEESLQLFLLQTASPGRLTSSLCAAVTGRVDSAAVLEQIERANLFLTSLEGTGQWYRYHALFAEAMQHEARNRLGEKALRELSNKASHWYELHSLLHEAIETALAAGETERAALLMTRFIEARDFNQITEFQTLERWIAPLPEGLLRAFPLLSQTYAVLLLFGAEQQTPALRSRLEHYLQLAESSLQLANDMPRLGEVLALRALTTGRWNEFAAAFHFASQALKLLPVSETFWRSSCLLGIGTADLLAGRLNEAIPPIQEALAIVEVSGNDYALRAALFAQGNIALGQGKLYQAADLFRRVLKMAGDDRSDRGLALAGLATLSYAWNELATAAQEAQEAYTLGLELGNELLMVLVAPTLVRVLYALGQVTQARDTLQQLSAHLTQPGWQREIETYRIWLALASGDLASVERWVISRQSLVDEETATEAQLEREQILLARWQLTQGKTRAALDALYSLLPQAQSQRRVRSELEIHLLIARSLAIKQRMPEAKQTLTEALELAYSAGYQRPFLDEGEALASLLRALLPTTQERPLAASIRNLLRTFALEHGATPSLEESLSPRERLVLRLLVAGRSNPEIARELVVSINTVKAQVKSIYRKLAVSSRREASDVARQLRLL